MRWCAVANVAGQTSRPEWQRTAALDDDGTVYIPAVIASTEANVMLCAMFDGIAVVTDNGHLFVPAGWVAKEFPEVAEVARLIERRTREHFDRKEP